jgi:hypothetical protein
MKILDFFLFLWVIFALLDPDPDPLDPDPATQINADPDPEPWLKVIQKFKRFENFVLNCGILGFWKCCIRISIYLIRVRNHMGGGGGWIKRTKG